MNRFGQIIYWLTVSLILFVVFGLRSGNFMNTFYFLVFFMPVLIACSWYFNVILLEKYLIKRRYRLFALYTVYLFIISLDVEMVLVFIAFMLISYFDYDSMPEIISNYKVIPLVMYFIVILSGLISLVVKLMRKEDQKQRDKDDYILLRANRENHRVRFSDILYIESMADYVRIYLFSHDTLTSREKISHLQEKLPKTFLRIHRSYLINTDHISAYRKEYVVIGGKELPVSRTYKQEVNDFFIPDPLP